MNARRTALMLIAASVALACAAFVVIRQHADAERARAAARQQHATLDAELRARNDVIAANERRRAELEAALAGSAPTAATTTSNAANAQPSTRELFTRNPALHALWQTATRARFTRAYQPFYDARQLSPEQIAKFEEILLLREERLVDIAHLARNGASSAPPNAAALRQDAEMATRHALLELLGADAAQALQGYEQQQEARALVQEFAGLATVESAPLTRAQADRLVEIIAAATFPETKTSRGKRRLVDWTVVDAHARDLLTPVQFELFERVNTRTDLQLDAALLRATQMETSAHGAPSDRSPRS